MKILKRFFKVDPFTLKEKKYIKFEIPNEETTVRNVKLRVSHVYCALDPNYYHIDKITKYWEPFNNTDYNLKKDFNAYRKHQGLMMPRDIKKLRKNKYGLSLRELATILGLGYATISKIENNDIIQSISQDSTLRLLLDPKEIVNLIKVRLPIVLDSPDINSNVLNGKMKKINRNENNLKYKLMRQSINTLANLTRGIVLGDNDNLNSNPKNLDSLIKDTMGVRIIYTESKYDGFVRLYNNYDHPEITISKDDSSNRQRFTIAHELGHLILHEKWSPFPTVKLTKHNNDSSKKALSVMYRGYPGTSTSLSEKQADEFAGDFLMPAKGVKEIYRNSDDKDLDDLKFSLSDKYHVSTDAAYTRLSNMKKRHLL